MDAMPCQHAQPTEVIMPITVAMFVRDGQIVLDLGQNVRVLAMRPQIARSIALDLLHLSKQLQAPKAVPDAPITGDQQKGGGTEIPTTW